MFQQSSGMNKTATNSGIARYKFLIAKATNTTVFTDVTRCMLVEVYRLENGGSRFLRNVCFEFFEYLTLSHGIRSFFSVNKFIQRVLKLSL